MEKQKFIVVYGYSEKKLHFIYRLFILTIGWYDKIQILDFGLTHKTGGANHKINDFCFLKFFISIKFDPHQAQKMIFHHFEQCSISLDMFE